MRTREPSAERMQPIVDLLMGYLLGSSAGQLPGADGLLVTDSLADYRAMAAAGEVPTEQELCMRHPELAPRLAAFFLINDPPDE